MAFLFLKEKELNLRGCMHDVTICKSYLSLFWRSAECITYLLLPPFYSYFYSMMQSNNEKLLENPYLQMRGILQLANDFGSGL